MSIPSNTSDASPSPQPDQAQSQAQQAQSQSSTQPAQPTKRSSRRANTAERRATHNAVERARRETLNGRFLDLAAMLPNLAAVRRPSKSAIVNSSIALIHNQQRSRIIAARELRLLNAEANALRQELNEWRARNSLPRVEEPIRSVDFGTLLNVEDVDMGEEMALGGRRSFDGEGFDEGDEYGEDGDEGELVSPESAVQYNGMNMGMPMRGAPMQYPAQQTQQQIAAQQQQQQQQQALFEQQKAAMARAHQAQLVQSQAQAQRYTPPTQPHHQSSQSQQMMFNESMFPADLYSGPTTQSWSQKAINSLATPPGSAHGHVSQKPSSYANTANSAFLSAQHGMFKPGSYPANGFLNPGSEDDQSDGSSHFSGVSDLMGAEQPFNFGLSNSNVGMNMTIGMGMGSTGMMGYPAVGMGGMMQMPPSPPHTGSPNHSNPQSRRPSVHIPAHGSNKSSPSPVPVSAQQYGMGLMM